ncbi:MAG: ArnT family glycosyltransferase [Candidatus Hodarchaeales archaeon]|jgi:hypothetical protein
MTDSHFNLLKTASYIVLLLAVVLFLSTKGITDESVISLNGDMPKYLMNGAYIHDLIDDMPITDPFEHAYLYIFGVSVFSARLTIVFFMLLAVIAWFLLVRSIYDEKVAFLSSLLFVTTPFIVKYSTLVMSEIPTLSLIIVATYLFYKYLETDRKGYAYLSAISLSLSIYAKHIAVFMFPVFLVYLIIKKGARRLIQKELIISYIIILVIILPLIPITLKFAQSNVAAVASKTINPSYYFFVLWNKHLTPPVLILSLLSIFVSAYIKDRRAILFFLWIGCSYLLITYLGFQGPRYAIFWIPAFCLFAAASINYFQRGSSRRALVTILLLLTGAYQFVAAWQIEPQYSRGYEQAARYVLENRKGVSVLYSGVNDTGYFIFFVRKHDPDRNLIILRANKILATSKMNRIVEERIDRPEGIYKILKDYGVGYVIIKDTETGSRALEWLREEVKNEKFILHKKIALQSNNPQENNVMLAIYEYMEYSPPKGGKTLQMKIPLMGDSIEIPFKDLTKPN